LPACKTFYEGSFLSAASTYRTILIAESALLLCRDALSVLFEGCPHIAELSLTDCQMVDEGGLAAAKQLQLLSLAGCKVASWAMAAEVRYQTIVSQT
jgi:hypothetical protein